MHILLNGKETEIAEHITLQKLLEKMKIKPQMVACELNSIIVRRADFPTTQLSPGDRVEILQMIGGG